MSFSSTVSRSVHRAMEVMGMRTALRYGTELQVTITRGFVFCLIYRILKPPLCRRRFHFTLLVLWHSWKNLIKGGILMRKDPPAKPLKKEMVGLIKVFYLHQKKFEILLSSWCLFSIASFEKSKLWEWLGLRSSNRESILLVVGANNIIYLSTKNLRWLLTNNMITVIVWIIYPRNQKITIITMNNSTAQNDLN